MAEFDFSRPTGTIRKWTLILGENDIGKTSILRAVALLFAGPDALRELLEKPDTLIRIGAKTCKVSATVLTGKNEAKQISLNFGVGDKIDTILNKNATSLDLLSSNSIHPVCSFPACAYGAGRHPMPRNWKKSKKDEYFHAERAKAVGTLFTSQSHLKQLEEWLSEMKTAHRLIALKLLREFAKDITQGIMPLHWNHENKMLIFRTPDGLVPYRELGDGHKNLLGWCGDFLHHVLNTCQFRLPLEARVILLIDGLDLHLHPIQQRMLRRTLLRKFKNVQIIASTYSPFTAQQFDEGELFVLRRDASTRIKVTHLSGAPHLLTSQQIISGPAFGIETSLSIQMQRAEKLWKTTKSSSAKKKLRKLQRATLIPIKPRVIDLLKTIERELVRSKQGSKGRILAKRTNVPKPANVPMSARKTNLAKK